MGRQPGAPETESSSRDPQSSTASRKRERRSDSEDDADLPADVKEAEKQLRAIQKEFRGETDSGFFSAAPRGDRLYSDFFGSENQKSASRDQVAHNKAVMEQFKQTIQSPLSPPAFLSSQLASDLGLKPLGGMAGPTPGSDPLNSVPWSRSPFSISDGLDFGSSATFSTLPGLSADTSLTGQTPPAAQPAPPPPAQPSLTPPTPNFVFPKRVFQ
jgi:hypothetical protein